MARKENYLGQGKEHLAGLVSPKHKKKKGDLESGKGLFWGKKGDRGKGEG